MGVQSVTRVVSPAVPPSRCGFREAGNEESVVAGLSPVLLSSKETEVRQEVLRRPL